MQVHFKAQVLIKGHTVRQWQAQPPQRGGGRDKPQSLTHVWEVRDRTTGMSPQEDNVGVQREGEEVELLQLQTPRGLRRRREAVPSAAVQTQPAPWGLAPVLPPRMLTGVQEVFKRNPAASPRSWAIPAPHRE